MSSCLHRLTRVILFKMRHNEEKYNFKDLALTMFTSSHEWVPRFLLFSCQKQQKTGQNTKKQLFPSFSHWAGWNSNFWEKEHKKMSPTLVQDFSLEGIFIPWNGVVEPEQSLRFSLSWGVRLQKFRKVKVVRLCRQTNEEVSTMEEKSSGNLHSVLCLSAEY